MTAGTSELTDTQVRIAIGSLQTIWGEPGHLRDLSCFNRIWTVGRRVSIFLAPG
jgi:hypothetical protein